MLSCSSTCSSSGRGGKNGEACGQPTAAEAAAAALRRPPNEFQTRATVMGTRLGPVQSFVVAELRGHGDPGARECHRDEEELGHRPGASLPRVGDESGGERRVA